MISRAFYSALKPVNKAAGQEPTAMCRVGRAADQCDSLKGRVIRMRSTTKCSTKKGLDFALLKQSGYWRRPYRPCRAQISELPDRTPS